jgi:hypothetical protein
MQYKDQKHLTFPEWLALSRKDDLSNLSSIRLGSRKIPTRKRGRLSVINPTGLKRELADPRRDVRL